MKTFTGATASETGVGEPTIRELTIPIDGISVGGDLVIPQDARGLVMFAPGSIGRESPRNRFIARQLEAARLGTLLFDLLTPKEGIKDAATGYWHFDIELLAHRLIAVTRWLTAQEFARDHPVGYFGSGTGAAAALVAAARLGSGIGAVVSRGGRVDLAGEALPRVTPPTLLIVGGEDPRVLERNRTALARLTCEKRLTVIPGATHFFEEQGALGEVASCTTEWFQTHLKPPQ